MRMLTLILLGLFSCLICGGSTAPYTPSAGTAEVVLSVDTASSEQWLCERECNSDLNLPRVLSDVAPSANTPLPQRDVRGAERFAVKCGVACSDGIRESSRFGLQNLSACVCRVDYYIYRLHRLII